MAAQLNKRIHWKIYLLKLQPPIYMDYTIFYIRIFLRSHWKISPQITGTKFWLESLRGCRCCPGGGGVGLGHASDAMGALVQWRSHAKAGAVRVPAKLYQYVVLLLYGCFRK